MCSRPSPRTFSPLFTRNSIMESESCPFPSHVMCTTYYHCLRMRALCLRDCGRQLTVMASKSTKRPEKYEPLPRFLHISQCVMGGKVVLQGGLSKHSSEETNRHLTTVVEVLEPLSETWEQKLVSGHAPPPGTRSAASASLGDDLYTFGGWDEMQHLSTLRRLDCKTWVWSIVSPWDSPGAPTPKCGCGMVAFGAESLGIFGGRNKQTSRWLNEFHLYSLVESKFLQLPSEIILLQKSAHVYSYIVFLFKFG